MNVKGQLGTTGSDRAGAGSVGLELPGIGGAGSGSCGATLGGGCASGCVYRQSNCVADGGAVRVVVDSWERTSSRVKVAWCLPAGKDVVVLSAGLGVLPTVIVVNVIGGGTDAGVDDQTGVATEVRSHSSDIGAAACGRHGSSREFWGQCDVDAVTSSTGKA